MKSRRIQLLGALFAIQCLSARAEDVRLPAPVLQWSFYIFLLFAVAVGLGIFFLRDKKTVEQTTLRSIIDEGGRRICSVGLNDSVTDCVRRMSQEKVGAMLVMDHDELLGIFTERDSLTRVIAAGLDPSRTVVGDVMTKNPYCVSPDTTVAEAMRIVSAERFRHLPVVKGGEVLGVISSGDLTHSVVSGPEAGER